MDEEQRRVLIMAQRKQAVMVALLVSGGWVIGWTTALLVIGIARL